MKYRKPSTDPVLVEERKQQFTRAMNMWLVNRSLSKVMTREKLASLEGIQRHLALSKSLIINLITVCRLHKRADAKQAVLVLITLLCDNDRALCHLTS